MSVTLRYKKNAKGSITPYIDIYENGMRKREYLKHLKLRDKPKKTLDRDNNKQNKILAEQIRDKKARDLQANVYHVIPATKTSTDVLKFFATYIERYSKKDKRLLRASYAKFQAFMSERSIRQLSTNHLSKGLIIDFKGYLETSMNGETPSNYFKKFKMMVQGMVNEGLMHTNPAIGVSIKRSDTIKKDILNFEEIARLHKAPITNEEVKRAFLFCCYTGLRFCDVKEVSHINVQNNLLKITQKKTGKPVIVPLNETALAIINSSLATKGSLFNLPSHTACLKGLRVWVKNAGIDKHITWHCARHSFGTAIIEYGADVSSATSLLGQTSFASTMRYVRVVEKLKERAVGNLPVLR